MAGIGAGAVVVASADRHAGAVLRHRHRPPELVPSGLTVDVAAQLGPRPAALGVHADVASVGTAAVVQVSADRHARAVGGHR